MKLVASAIVRNEADRYLEPWLEHLLTFCDEVRLLDDGSTDGTEEIAAGYEGVLVRLNTGGTFYDDESAARNALLRWTIEGQPTYVLAIDADEFIGDTGLLRESIESEKAVYALTMREAWKIDPQRGIGLRVDGLWGDRNCPVLWRAPRVLNGRAWQIPPRKLACGREPLHVRRSPSIKTDVGIYHFGWARESERQSRAARYAEHDQGKFHADKHLQSILWPDRQVSIRYASWPKSIPHEVAERALRP